MGFWAQLGPHASCQAIKNSLSLSLTQLPLTHRINLSSASTRRDINLLKGGVVYADKVTTVGGWGGLAAGEHRGAAAAG